MKLKLDLDWSGCKIWMPELDHSPFPALLSPGSILPWYPCPQIRCASWPCSASQLWLRPVSSFSAPYRWAHLDGYWVRSRVAGHTSCHNGSGVQTPERIKWDTGSRLQPGNKSFRMLKNYFCGRGNWVGKREAISELHGFSFWRKEF